MSRRKADPVDATFDLWREMTDDQRANFDQRVKGFWAAVTGFGLDGKAPTAPRTRQRKAKPNGSQRENHGVAEFLDRAGLG